MGARGAVNKALDWASGLIRKTNGCVLLSIWLYRLLNRLGENMSVQAIVTKVPTKSILTVDDNPLNMMLFNGVLERSCYSKLKTNDGRQVASIARNDCPDLKLMDIQLPEVSGLEVTKWMKYDETLCDIPIISVTAFAMKGDKECILRGVCEGYISKPIPVVIFLETVTQHIG